MSERESGIVKWFDGRKGYGFIERESDEDVFVHFQEIRGTGFRTLKEGQKVTFELISRGKGLAAKDVEAL